MALFEKKMWQFILNFNNYQTVQWCFQGMDDGHARTDLAFALKLEWG
jgi:hypothetical protein